MNRHLPDFRTRDESLEDFEGVRRDTGGSGG
jgi:hypothetical protein